MQNEKVKILESTDRKQSTNHFMYLLNRQVEYSKFINWTAVPSSRHTKIASPGLNQPQRYLLDRLNYTTIGEPVGSLPAVKKMPEQSEDEYNHKTCIRSILYQLQKFHPHLQNLPTYLATYLATYLPTNLPSYTQTHTHKNNFQWLFVHLKKKYFVCFMHFACMLYVNICAFWLVYTSEFHKTSGYQYKFLT